MAAREISPRRKQTKTSENNDISKNFLKIEDDLCKELPLLHFEAPVCYVYNPLEYASEPHCNFVNKYCVGTKKVLFLGMNPGPFGMAQNGVPFGDTKYVKDWLHINGKVGKPPNEHPKRLIQGLECKRSEVSGSRLWGFFEEHCKIPETFFSHCYIHNYCPLVFMTETGKNITPPNIPASQRKQLFELCDSSLVDTVQLLEIEIVVGIGKFAEGRSKLILKDLGVKVCGVMHPSPASPAANAGWADIAKKQLDESGIMSLLT